MFQGSMPTVFVSNMDATVRFYTETLGFKLAARYGNHFASIDCGGSTIGLHPASAQNPAGSVSIGFRAAVPIGDAAERLKAAKATLRGDIIDDQQLLLLNFQDPDGTPLYVTEMKERR